MIDGDLRKIFKKHITHFDWTTIETGFVARGVPDANYCVAGVEGWIEYKVTKGRTVQMRPDQVGWIARRMRHGGRCYIAVRQMNRAGDALWLFTGHAAQPLALKQPIETVAGAFVLGSWHNGPARWDWPRIAALLQHSGQ